MKCRRWFSKAVLLVAVLALVIIGGTVAAQELVPPTPVPHLIAPAGEAPQSPDAGTVTAYDASTGDSTWAYRDWFFPGETITYIVGVNNTTGSNKDFKLTYTVYGPDGEVVSGGDPWWTYSLTTGPGITGWGIQYSVPAGHGGWQTLVGQVTYNGNTTQATSTGHFVYGSQSWNHLFDDGFQFNSDLTNWSAKVTDNGDLYVSAQAALVHDLGLAVRIDDNKPLYLLDETPWSEWTYSAAFFFDPNSIVMSNGNVHNIFVERNAAGLAINIVQFRRYSNKYQLRLQTRTDGAAYVNTLWRTIGDEPHRLTVGWSAATGPGQNNGSYTFGIQRYPLNGTEWWYFKSNIDNDTRRIDSVLLGPSAGIDKPTRGTYYLDGFDSWR